MVSGNLTLFSSLNTNNLLELPITSLRQFHILEFVGSGVWAVVSSISILFGASAYMLERERENKLNWSRFVQVYEEMLGKRLEYSWAWEMLYRWETERQWLYVNCSDGGKPSRVTHMLLHLRINWNKLGIFPNVTHLISSKRNTGIPPNPKLRFDGSVLLGSLSLWDMEERSEVQKG